MDGIAGVYSPGDSRLVEKIYEATGSLLNRGDACAGMTIGNKKRVYLPYKNLGFFGDVIIDEIKQLYQDLEPSAAIGNIGYAKSRNPTKKEAEPILINPKTPSKFELALTMDGYLVKEDDLKSELEHDYDFETRNKTEVVGSLLHKYISENGISFEAGKRLVDKLHGRATFALVALVHDGKETSMIALNDDKAFEPFCYGTVNGAFVVSSESFSHRRLGSFMEREYDGAEMTICSPNEIETKRLREEIMMPDNFQAIYFGYPDSFFRGKEIFDIRRRIGIASAEYYRGSRAEIVIANPDSGWGVSTGLSEGLGLPLYPGLIKNPQAIRTFQQGEKRIRSVKVGLKFGGIDSLLRNRKVAGGDDSIVKASVAEGGSVWWIFNCGAELFESWVSYAHMLFPSFKEWHNGRKSLEELAVQRAFNGDNPYDKTLEEINEAVARLIIKKLKQTEDREYDLDVKYNKKEIIESITGPGSFQALDASYPIDEKFWPDWLKIEVEKFNKYREAA